MNHTHPPAAFDEETNARRELFQLLLAEAGLPASSTDDIRPGEYTGSPPLSFAQERLWFLQQLEPNSPFYNVPMAWQCSGSLDLPILQRSLNEIIRRHDVLRAIFTISNGQPAQSIRPSVSLEIPVIDLQHVPAASRTDEALRLFKAEAQRPFDLATGPLLRAVLLRLADHEHILIIVVHHLVADGLSLGVLVHELQLGYTAFAAGQTPALPDLKIQFADVAHWERQRLQGATLNRQRDYWLRQLANLSPLALPTDRPRPPRQTYIGTRQSLLLSAELTAALRALSRSARVTLFTTLLAGFKVLLSRYTNQTDVAVGTAVANRHHPGSANLIGLFLNMLVLRSDLSDDLPFNDFLQRVNSTVMQAREHQELPFEKVIEALRPERDGSRTPLFQVMFSYQQVQTAAIDLPQLTLRPLEQPDGIAKFDLTLSVDDREQELRLSLEYNTDLFEAATIERMLMHYRSLLEAVVNHPDQRLSRLPLLTLKERACQLETWNQTSAPYPSDTPLHELVAAHAARSPDVLAVVDASCRLRYGELDQRANRLAWHLQSLGVGAETRVGVCLPRCADVAIALLAVLKAGGCYIPLDPDYPTARLQFMLEDAQAAVVLTQSGIGDDLPATSAAVACLDTLALDGYPDTPPPRRAWPDQLAYMIYTSGSTGKPKGVMVLHRGLSNLAEAQAHMFGARPGSQVLQFASPSFDASIFEMVMALKAGATLHFAAQDHLLPGPDLTQVLREQAITHVTLPPSVLATLTDTDLPALETIVSAGEACTAAIVNRWAPGRQFFNAYGPTEITIWATTAVCQASQEAPPIGRPIANTQIYVLDAQMQPAPIGVAGEIYIGGVGLARGYFDRPELTAEKFLPNPFAHGSAAAQGSRLYRTGDLGRWRADGTLDFLGRIDQQVKLRGYRIELSEIESVLASHPAIQTAVVQLDDTIPGDSRLEAYLVLSGTTTPTFAQLRRHLRAHLPDYMVPSRFVVVDSVPLTSNGKVDRQQLRKMTQEPGDQIDHETAYVAPRTAEEEQIARIWAEVLQRERVGINDNFFELGGHSLLATQVMARIQELFRTKMPIHLLFGAVTVAELAQVVAHYQATAAAEHPLDTITGSAQDERHLLEQLDRLSDDQVDALLNTMLQDEE